MSNLRIVFGRENIVGVRGAVLNGTEVIYLTALVPDKYRSNFRSLIKENKAYTLGSHKANMANCFIDKELSSPKYKGSYYLLINNKASAKNASLEEQYFLVKKGEDIDKELKRQFFENNMKKLPLPLKEEWQDYFWEQIAHRFEPLESVGQTPYNGFVLKLPDFEQLNELIELSHAASEFKAKFKRVPQLKSLLSVMDIENFNFKEWQNFLKFLGGIEEFKKLSPENQVAMVRAFEMLGNNPSVKSEVTLWHGASMKRAQTLLRLEKDKNRKQQIKSAFKSIFEQFKEKEYDLLYAVIGNFEKLFKEEAQNIRNKNWDAIKKFLAQISYEDVATGAEELARVCSAAKVSESEFKKFEALYFKNLERGIWGYRSFPTVNGIAGKVSWELLDMTVPRAWVVGIETYCCMHPDSIGGACLEYAGDHIEESGILRIHEKGKTVAQSFMWLSEPDKNGLRTMVLDNIEVAGREIRGTVIEAYKNFAKEMEIYAPLFGIKAITVGGGYSDVQLKSFCFELDKDSPLYAKIPKSLGYTDARTQWLLKEFK